MSSTAGLASADPSRAARLRRAWRRLAWLAAAALGGTIARAEPTITEFMASNATILADEDGAFPDWVEIFNPDATPANLAGWFLTDDQAVKKKWAFPAVTLPAGGYLVVFASDKDRRDPAKRLHANFKLSANGGYLALIRPDGVTPAREFAPGYPAQFTDLSYGITQPAAGETPQLGFFRTPTPGARNGAASAQLIPGGVAFSRAPGLFAARFALTLTGAAAGQRIRYTLTAPAAAGAAAPEPTAASPLYTAPIDIASTVIVRAGIFSADDKVRSLPASAQFVLVAPSAATFSSQLPVLVLDHHGAGAYTKDDIDHPAWAYLFAPGNNPFATAPTLATPATMTVRGNFSSAFPKKSYSLSFLDDLGRSDPQAPLGLDRATDWALYAPWSTDRTYVRNAFVYALSNRLGRWAPRTRFVEMFYNQDADGLTAADYAGIGVLTDRLKIDNHRIDIANLSPDDNTAPDITGGYIIKFDPVPDPAHYTFITDRGNPSAAGTAVVIDTPAADSLTPAQRTYIRGYLQTMENALYADDAAEFRTRTYLDYIDLPSWVDHHLLEVFSGNVDGLYRSEYFTKDRGGKLVAGPVWDFDSSLGNGDPRGADPRTWQTGGGIEVWNYAWFGKITGDPEFMQAWVDRWQSLRRDQLLTANLTALADSLAAQIGTAAAARDAARWPNNASQYPGGFLGEVAHLKDWLTARAAWIDEQFVAPPRVVEAVGVITFTPPAGAVLAYTTDGSDPRASGGDVAPGVILTATPVTLSATANLHVRAYNSAVPNLRSSSPWSSAVGGAKSTPLSPPPRLLNLSARAVVGGGEDALIAGVAVADTASKSYLVRAIGPTLAAFGVGNTLPDPALRIVDARNVDRFRNTGWSTGADAARLPGVATEVGAFPLAPGRADSALLAPLASGNFSAVVSSPTNRSGVGLVELYATDANGRTGNLSTRARVRTGEGVLSGGLVVQGPAYKRMLLRAVGPTLAVFGVGSTLADPVLIVRTGQTVIATNDDWSAGNAATTTAVTAAAARVGAFALPIGSRDAALLLTLPPGAHTVEVSGKAGAEGVALLEIYDVP
ncbi:MAG: hypothetical protein RLZZ15_343 [Verrucomicrobiota bacterium]